MAQEIQKVKFKSPYSAEPGLARTESFALFPITFLKSMTASNGSVKEFGPEYPDGPVKSIRPRMTQELDRKALEVFW